MKFLTLRAAIEKAQNEKKDSVQNVHAASDQNESNKSVSVGSGDCGYVGVANTEGLPKSGRRFCVFDGKHFLGRNREKVAGGVVLWKPIDKQAAMLLAKAPWYHHPPPQTKQPNKNKPMSMNVETRVAHKAQDPNRQEIRDHSSEEISRDLAAKFTENSRKTIDGTAELVDKAMDARAALDVMCDSWKVTWLEFMQTGNERLRELRMLKVAFDTETRQLMAGLRDVRSFIQDKSHEGEVAKLQQFVDLCERLQKLKREGFLDAISDTILRLMEGESK